MKKSVWDFTHHGFVFHRLSFTPCTFDENVHMITSLPAMRSSLVDTVLWNP